MGSPMAAIEAHLYTRKEPDANRIRESADVEVGHQRAWPLVEQRRLTDERSQSQVSIRPNGIGSVVGNAALLACSMNRRMRNRMSGGVGGRQGGPCIQPDWTHSYCILVVVERFR